MRIWHLTWATKGRVLAFPSVRERLEAVRLLVRIGGSLLLLFCIVDDHVHVVIFATREQAWRTAQALSKALGVQSQGRLGAADVREADTRKYQLWLVRYVLGQTSRHELATHAALWSGSAFQDLAGARVLPGWAPRFTEALPRWRLREAFSAVGLDPAPLEPADDPFLATLGPARLVAAAAAAAGADPDLPGRAAEVVAARRVAIALMRAVGLPTQRIAAILGRTPAAIRHLASDVPAPIEQAARRRLTLEVRVAALRAS